MYYCNVDGALWQPKNYDFVCSAHFVGNIPSKNPNSPAYIPTIFPEIYKKRSVNELQQNNRHDRYKAKQRKGINDTIITNKINNTITIESVCLESTSNNIFTTIVFPFLYLFSPTLMAFPIVFQNLFLTCNLLD